MNPILYTSLLTLVLVSCNDAKFGGENEQAAPAPQVQKQPQQAPARPACDPSQDQITLRNLPPAEQECQNRGGLYFYVDQRCYEFQGSRQTSCTFDSVKQELAKIGMSTSVIDDAISKNAKMTDCHIFNGKNIMAINFWYSDGPISCDYQPGMSLVTACFRVLPPGMNQSGSDQVEMARNCLNDAL